MESLRGTMIEPLIETLKGIIIESVMESLKGTHIDSLLPKMPKNANITVLVVLSEGKRRAALLRHSSA